MKEKTSNEIFHFKQFDVAQDHCAMKIGTDGVLLGALCPLPTESKHALRLLDIGTGTGLIALMLAQRLSEQGCNDFLIDAIEIDPEAAAQARENAGASPWGRNIVVHSCSLQEYMENVATDVSYDVIVSNPPFYNATLKPEDEARAVARHKDALPLSEIALGADRLLCPEGKLALIYPSDYDSEVMSTTIARGLSPTGICRIVTKEGKPCKRLASWFGKSITTSGSPLQSFTLAIRDTSGNYTEEYKKLTMPFYVSLR